MAVIGIAGEFRESRIGYGFMATLRAGWRAMRRHRRERRLIVALSRRPPHVVRDMGFDPEQIYQALDGSWDEINPAAFRSHLPRSERI